MDLKGIPESDYKKLSQLIGDDEAYKFLIKKEFNYRAVAKKILVLETKAYLKGKPIIYTIILVLLILTFIILIFEDLIFS